MGKIILGLDPGSVSMGFGIIEITEFNGYKAIEYGIFQLKKYKDHMLRMHYIYTYTTQLLHQHKPDEVAIETIFYGTNIQSMLKLGRAQGIAIAAALALKIPVKEYAPRKIKQSITGCGSAPKEQVAKMVSHMLGITIPHTLLDASDALAIALCHSQQNTAAYAKL